MNWQHYVIEIQTTSAFLSILLNFILILLIVNKSPEHLGSYRYLMAYTALFEVFYSFTDVFVSPTIFSHGSMFFVIISTKDSVFSKHTLLLSVCVWCGCFGSFMFLFCIQFIYRYIVVTGSKLIKSFNDYRIVFWMMIPIVSGVAWGIVAYFAMYPRHQNDEILRYLLLKEVDLKYEDITYIGPECYYKTADGRSLVNKEVLLAITYYIVVMTISLSCIVYFSTRIFMRIRRTFKVSTTSSKYHRLQSQTFYALVTQALIPIILMHFPCSIVLATAMMDIDIGHASGIVSVTYAIFPALDPLPVMLIIQNYRGTLFNVISTPVNVFVRRNDNSQLVSVL